MIIVNIEGEHYWTIYNLGFKFKLSPVDRYIQMDLEPTNSLPCPTPTNINVWAVKKENYIRKNKKSNVPYINILMTTE
jgi:hypothetical protein